MLKKIFDPFIASSSLSVMARGLSERLLNASKLDAWFDEIAETQYTRELMFSSLFSLMSQVVCGSRQSINAAYQAAKEEVSTSIVAVYDKLKRIEPHTSAELVRRVAREAQTLIESLDGGLPPLLDGYRVKILDGNCIAATDHRIKELRTLAAGALPGKCLVVLDPRLKIPIDVFTCEDGHAQERSLLDEVSASVCENDLWIADRNFCTNGFLNEIIRADGYFIIREHKGLNWERASGLRAAGKVDTGKVFCQSIQITDSRGNAHGLRRIEVHLKNATRDGDQVIAVLTNLPTAAATAKYVAELYRQRWLVETAFQDLALHLNSEINALGYPRAALFGFCVALISYIGMAVNQAALRAVHGRERIEENFSGYYHADEIAGVYRGMMISIPAPHWRIFAQLTTDQMVGVLTMLAAKVDLAKFQKHRRGKKKVKEKPVYDKDTPHVSTAKILAKRKKS